MPSGAPAFEPMRILQADYSDASHAHAIVALLDAYAQDPAGGGVPLGDFAKAHLVQELAKRPQAFSVLGFDGSTPVGLVNCIEGFSTFACKPLINVHDVVVLASHRGQRAGERMLAVVEQIATARGACKLTLKFSVATTVPSGCTNVSALVPTSWTRRWAVRCFYRSGFEPRRSHGLK